MSDQKFTEPIFMLLNGVGNWRADSAWECFEYLDLHWPAARTVDYRRAKALCRVAIDGIVPPEQARRAVVALARRTGLLAAGPGDIVGERPAPYRFTPRRASGGPVSPRAAAALRGERPRTPPTGGVTLQ